MHMKAVIWMATCWLLTGAAAHAGVLTSATWVGDFQGTPFTLVSSGASLSASGSAAGTSISSVQVTVAAPTLTFMSFQGPAPLFVSQTLGGSQTIDSANSVNQGIQGAVNVYIGFDASGTLLFPVGLSAGQGGNFQTTAIVPGINVPVEVTVTFHPWTTGTQTFTGLTLRGLAMPDLTVSGTNSLANGVGSITLVSPTVTRACAGSVFGTFPCLNSQAATNTSTRVQAVATRLTLNFSAVPEPTAFILLGSAAAVALAALRRTKR